MQPDEWLRAIFNYGFPSVMLVAVCVGGWKLINKIIIYNKEREDKLMSLVQNQISAFNTTLLSTTEQIIEFRRANEEAHRYQREEHKGIMEYLETIKEKIKCN